MALLKNRHQKPFLDLNGPDGNAFGLLAYAKELARQMGYSDEKTEKVLADMRSGNYKHLVLTFDDHFGELIDVVLPSNWDDNT